MNENTPIYPSLPSSLRTTRHVTFQSPPSSSISKRHCKHHRNHSQTPKCRHKRSILGELDPNHIPETFPTLKLPDPFEPSQPPKCRHKRHVLGQVDMNQVAEALPTPKSFPAPEPQSSSTSADVEILLERRSQILQTGAKAHLANAVHHSLRLQPHEMQFEGMLEALPLAHLHALYARGTDVVPEMALLNLAEVEEKEMAALVGEMRNGLGKWGVARVKADEKRIVRMARGLLKEFVEMEAGGNAIGLEMAGDHGLSVALVTLARRMDRVDEMERRRWKEERWTSGVITAWD